MRDQVLKTMDSDLMIGQTGWKDLPDGIEGGDSVNRMSHYTFLKSLNKALGYPIGDIERLPWRWGNTGRLISLFESKEHPGEYVRHFRISASPFGWVAYCDGHYKGVLSRDQLISIIITLGYHHEHAMLWRLFWAHLRYRGLLFTNGTLHNGDNPQTAKLKWVGDPTLFEIFAAYLRGFSSHVVVRWFSPILWVLIMVCDLETLFGSVSWLLRRKENDIINHASTVIYGTQRLPTPTMWLAAKILSVDFVMKRLEAYWSGWRDSPYFVDLYRVPVHTTFRR